MIQRIQSIWLLLAGVFGIITLNKPFFFGSQLGLAATNLTGSSSFPILLMTIVVVALSFFAIFLFKNRKLQLTITIIDFILSIGLIALYFNATKDLIGNISLQSIFVFLIPVFLLLAARGIYKDRKLVKSVDRLRS